MISDERENRALGNYSNISFTDLFLFYFTSTTSTETATKVTALLATFKRILQSQIPNISPELYQDTVILTQRTRVR